MQSIFFGYICDPAKLLKKIDHLIASEMNIVLLEKKLAEVIITEMSASYVKFVLVSDFVAKPPGSLTPPDPESEKFKALGKKLHHVKNILIKEQLTDIADQE